MKIIITLLIIFFLGCNSEHKSFEEKLKDDIAIICVSGKELVVMLYSTGYGAGKSIIWNVDKNGKPIECKKK